LILSQITNQDIIKWCLRLQTSSVRKTSTFKIKQSSEKLNFNKLFSIEQLNNNPKKDGFLLLNIKSVIPNHYFKIMATHAINSFYDENKTLENNELLLKIPLQRQFENQ
jgi:hypothetical protein